MRPCRVARATAVQLPLATVPLPGGATCKASLLGATACGVEQRFTRWRHKSTQRDPASRDKRSSASGTHVCCMFCATAYLQHARHQAGWVIRTPGPYQPDKQSAALARRRGRRCCLSAGLRALMGVQGARSVRPCCTQRSAEADIVGPSLRTSGPA